MRHVVLFWFAAAIAGGIQTAGKDADRETEIAFTPVDDTSDSRQVSQDLKILDTIHPRGRPSGRLPAENFRLGKDTVVVMEITTFPPRSVRVDQYEDNRAGLAGMMIQARVFGRDTNTRRLNFVPLSFADCPVRLDVFRVISRRGKPAWSSASRKDSIGCPAIHPHGPQEVSAYWRVSDILDDSLKAGRYFLTMSARLADGRSLQIRKDSLYLTADPIPPITDVTVLAFDASTRVTGLGPRTLSTRIVATNKSSKLLTLSFGSCALEVFLYPVRSSSAQPVWRSSRRAMRKRPGAPYSGYACTMELRVPTLAPGDSTVFGLEVPLAEILADSLPFGRYRARAVLALGGSRSFDLGEVTLDAQPDSMPRSKTVTGLRYTALSRIVDKASRSTPGGVVRTLVLVTNTTKGNRDLWLPDGCGVIGYAFKTTAGRDSLPLGKVDWQDPGKCGGLNMRTHTLRPAERLLVFTDKPVADIPEPLRHGTYYMLAWVPGTPGPLVNAGSIHLGD